MAEFIKAFLHAHVPDKDIAAMDDKITKQSIVMNKRARKARKKQLRTKKGCFTHQTRRRLGFNRLLPMKANYIDYLPLNALWTDYMKSYLAHYLSPDCDFQCSPSDARTANFLVLLSKADLHGAILRVTNSRHSGLSGVSGIVLAETRNTFHLLSAENTVKLVPKQPCVFETRVAGLTLTLYGRCLQQRAADRGYKKPPPYTTIEL